MKKLELSTRQLFKLNKMYNYFYFKKEKSGTLIYLYNNWYEFTIRFLSQKIFNKLSIVEDSKEISPLKLCSYQDDFGRAILMQDVHPVEYLYPLFLKIKS